MTKLEDTLERFKNKHPRLMRLNPVVFIDEIKEMYSDIGGVKYDPPLPRITVQHPFLFDNRLVPDSYENIPVLNVTMGSFPKEFPSTTNEDIPLEVLYAPKNYEAFVINNLDLIRRRLKSPNMSKSEALDALTGDFEKHKNWCRELREKRIRNPEFYLRDLIDDFRGNYNSEFLKISDFDYLQILAVIINHNVPNSGVRNITSRYLNEIKIEHILAAWDEAKKAMLKAFDFFENHLNINTPYLIPRYFYFTITAYLYKNISPNYDFLKKYFWFYSFHSDLLSNTTQLAQHIEFLNNEKTKQP